MLLWLPKQGKISAGASHIEFKYFNQKVIHVTFTLNPLNMATSNVQGVAGAEKSSPVSRKIEDLKIWIAVNIATYGAPFNEMSGEKLKPLKF